MAVRGSRKITRGVEEMPQLCETLSELLSCSPIRLKPPWSHGCFLPGDHGAKTPGSVKEQECGGLRDGGEQAFEQILQAKPRRPRWLPAPQLLSIHPSEICSESVTKPHKLRLVEQQRGRLGDGSRRNMRS